MMASLDPQAVRPGQTVTLTVVASEKVRAPSVNLVGETVAAATATSPVETIDGVAYALNYTVVVVVPADAPEVRRRRKLTVYV